YAEYSALRLSLMHRFCRCNGYPLFRRVSCVASPPSIPGYELLQPLGGGPLTCVFAARRNSDDLPCVIKLPRGDWPDHADAVRLLRLEARALTAVSSPHVVRLVDAHVSDSPHFVVME